MYGQGTQDTAVHDGHRSLLARALCVLLVLVAALAAQTALAPSSRADSSPDGRLVVTRTASPSTVPLGGGPVTYTYTARSTMALSRLTFANIQDGTCGNIVYVGGLGNGTTLNPGATATWTCTTTVRQTTTGTVAIDFRDYLGMHSVGRDTSTVTMLGGANSCDTVWYSSVKLNATDGWGAEIPAALGTLSQTGAPTQVTTTDRSYGGTTANYGSPALAINPLDPSWVYFVPRTSYGNSSAGLIRYNTVTRAFAVVQAATQPTNRLAFDAAGNLWSLDVNGTLWKMAAGTTTWVSKGAITVAGKTSPGSLDSGDLTFDGLGNMWIIGSDAASGLALLYTVSAAQLTASKVSGQYVGELGEGAFNGIAFSGDGTLYATSVYNPLRTSTSRKYSTVYTVDIVSGEATPVSTIPAAGYGGIADLASCATPKPELRVTKTAGSETTSAGSTLTYTIVVENIGELPATGVTFADATPTNASHVSATLNGAPVGTAGQNHWATAQAISSPGATPGVIAAGSRATVTMTVRVASQLPAGATQVCNQGSALFTGLTGAILTDDPAKAGAGEATCVPIAVPKIDVVKTPSESTTPPGGGPVTYTYTLTNVGTEPLGNVRLTDDKCPNPVLQPATDSSGDADGDARLDLGEEWVYTCTQTLTATTTNVAVANGTGTVSGQPAPPADDTVTVVVPPKPGIDVVKKGSTTELDGLGDAKNPVTYTYTVTNTGTEPLRAVTLADDRCSAVTGPTGDANANAVLERTETWTYRCVSRLTATTTNVATATGTGTSSGTVVADKDTWTVTVRTPAVDVAKSAGAVTGPDASGRYSARYTVTVRNTGAGTGSYGPIVDTPAFDATTTTVVGASWTGQTTGSATGAGPFTIGSAGLAIAAGATHTYTVTVAFTHVAGSGQTSACAATGTGLFNGVTATGETGPTTNNTACDTPPVYPPDTSVVHVDKLGPDGSPLAGATFAVYASDPATAGATPIPKGISADTAGGSTFTTAPLELDKTYWLVETRAPGGHELLAAAARFTVTDKGITLVGEAPGVVVSGTKALTLVVTDLVAPQLPRTGGGGADLPMGGAAVVLLALGGVLVRRRTLAAA